MKCELIGLIDANKMNIYINVMCTSIQCGNASDYAVSVDRWCLCTSRVLIIIINRAQHGMRGVSWLPDNPATRAVQL